jgi:hypothetical protein
MNALERAEKLRQEADTVLGMIRLAELVRPYGMITPTGSYALDVMAYPDIDVYIPRVSVNVIFEIGAAIAEVEEVRQVVFEKSNDPSLPDGLYLKPRIYYGDWGRPWKVDIWSINDETLQSKIAMMDGFCRKMTPVLREMILNYKQAVMTIDLRTPMSSGYFIYRAFLDEGLVDFPDVTRYLYEHGIRIY